jgi:hypothetical protein
MNDDFRDNPIIEELLKLPHGEYIEIAELIQKIDPHDQHLEAKIHAEVTNYNLEQNESRVRLSMRIARLKP